MQVVEKHIVDRNHFFFREVDRLCFLSKNLFNYANYLIRQKFIFEGKYLNYNAVQKLCQGTPDYVALPAKVSQQVLLRLHESWQSFFAACTEYKEKPQKFLGKPKIPKYKHKTQGRNVVTYTNQSVSKEWLKQGVIHLSKTSIFLTTSVKKVRQTRIVPKLYHYVIEIVYEKPETKAEQEIGGIAGIDIGLNNLATITSNQKEFRPLLDISIN